ncbi:MAG: diaminopimelate decarboxylase [Clostridiales bacterium]|nr:diaminopimelate decarboxylase [Clostridiales bacterium]
MNYNSLCENISVNEQGHLTFAGQDVVILAKEYSTPLYLMDEARIRSNCRVYTNTLRECFGENALPLYASKAASFAKMYSIVSEEGFGTDVVSSGELYTALLAGIDAKNIFFHSNNKTDADIAYGIDKGVGHFVVDNVEELDAINEIALSKGVRQGVLLRLTPGIDPHTYAAVATGKVDSKFGSAIETGQAKSIAAYALTLKGIKLEGFHCHVGSQVFDADVYMRSAEIMLSFFKQMKDEYGYETEIFDMGGGFGVRYVQSDPYIDIAESIRITANFVKAKALELGIKLPLICMEPGRSIVADAGMTVYTAGTVKKITGYKNYVSIDGSMADNPRYALYGSKYTVIHAGRALDECNFECSLVGRCCESGDIIQENIMLPDGIKRGDVIAVATTGAYNYSMSSNYNRLTRPPVVMLSNGTSYVAVKRESLEDIVRNDVL